MNLLPWKVSAKASAAGARRRKRPQAQRQQPAQPLFQWRPTRWLMVTAGLLLVVGSLLWYLPKEQWLPIDSIRLVGRFEHVDRQALQQRLQPYLGQGFFTVDIAGMRQQIESLPWVREASIRREWPNRLLLRVIERVAVARFGERRLIDRNGELFEENTENFQKLPLLRGYEEASAAILSRYAGISPRFAELGLNIRAWLEDGKGSLSLQLDSGLTLKLGSRKQEEKIEQFLAVYPRYIAPQRKLIRAIDFRYSNGFAVAWKKPGKHSAARELTLCINYRDDRNV